MKRCLLLFVVLLVCMAVTACGMSGDPWPESGIASVLPDPNARKLDIGFETGGSFSASVEKATLEDFNAYVLKCQEAGFDIEAESDSEQYIAYNEDGYKLQLSYYDYSKEMDIYLTEPFELGNESWPGMGLATLLPAIDKDTGKINTDSSTQFSAWFGEVPFEEYKSYVEKCITAGFDQNYSKNEKWYEAENADGTSLRVEYQGFGIIYISVEAPEEVTVSSEDNAETTTSSEESSEVSATSEAVSSTESEESAVEADTIRPEFKEMLDEYEAFFDEYCEFMEEYMDNPTDLDLLLEYADMMVQYSEMMEKLEAVEDSEMTDAELAYYLEVTNRITQKLLTVS